MGVESLDVADFILIASEALGLDVEQTFGITALAMVEAALHRPTLQIGAAPAYGPFPMKAAVLYATLSRYRPLVGRGEADQRVVAFLCLVEFIERNGFELELDPGLAEQLVGVTEGMVADIEFAEWLAPRLHQRTP